MCFEPENVQVSYMHFQDGLIKFSFLLSTLMGNLFLDGTSSEGGELPHCIIGRGKVVQLIRETGPKYHTCTVN